jgi:transcriptional regulator GlxA family with amidase domain
LTLTRLEQVSGLSARALQYNFRLQFACTPMQWVSQQRVDMARIELQHPDLTTSVTSVATNFGFANLGNFSRVYADRIGELPSVTLRRGLSRQ